LRFVSQKSAEEEETKTQSNGVPENLWRKEAFTTVGINKDRHARIIIMRPETILHKEAGYIFADCSRRNRFFLQVSGGPYIFRQLPHGDIEQVLCAN
jgi:hypothetical protein